MAENVKIGQPVFLALAQMATVEATVRMKVSWMKPAITCLILIIQLKNREFFLLNEEN